MSRAIFLLALLSVTAFSVDKPEIEWVRLYDDVTEILDIGEAVNGCILGSPDALFLIDEQGDRQWLITPDSAGWHYLKFQSVLPLPDGSIVSTGVGKQTDSSSFSVFIVKIDSEGSLVWIKNYDNPETTDYGYDIEVLPDDGFTVAARQGGDAWILRTDSLGETLWTREWGDIYVDRAADILYHDGGILAFMRGRKPGGNYGVFLVRYSLSGDFEWEASFPEWPGVYPDAQAMCEASDGGLLLMDNYWPEIFHTDYLGNPDWVTWPPGVDQPYGYSLSTTMDGGILYGGEIRGEPDSKSVCGVITRFDSLGNDLWYDNIYEESCAAIYSVIQLSQGGYIAAGYAYSVSAGNQGFLIKYAPETGIAEPDPPVALSLEVSPNPCSSVLSVSFCQPEAGHASIRVYDHGGRLVSTVADEEYPAGRNTAEWNVPTSVSSGCYIVQCVTEFASQSKSVIHIR